MNDTTTIFRKGRLRVSDLALNAISQGVLVTGADRRIRQVNDAFVAISGYGRQCDGYLVKPVDHARFVAQFGELGCTSA